MKDRLKKLLTNAYSPYYKFPVAAVVVTKDKKEFYGVNIENANGTSICAERNAISSAIALGYKKGDFEAIYVMLSNDKFGTPCFACRQVIVEFFKEEDKVISMNFNGETKEYTVKELCPFPFSDEDLK